MNLNGRMKRILAKWPLLLILLMIPAIVFAQDDKDKDKKKNPPPPPKKSASNNVKPANNPPPKQTPPNTNTPPKNPPPPQGGQPQNGQQPRGGQNGQNGQQGGQHGQDLGHGQQVQLHNGNATIVHEAGGNGGTTIRTDHGVTINRTAYGRRVVTVRPGGVRIVSVGHAGGFVERPLGRPGYVQRTYVVGGRSYVRV